MSIKIGQTAPAFSLYDSEKNKVALNDFTGKNIVLLFFPLAFTSVCTAELCSVRDNIASYNAANAQVLGISVDSLFTLGKFKADQNLNFPLLSDFNKEASTAYATIYADWILDMKSVSKRSALVIDSSGIVQYAEVLENAGDVPDFNAINKVLDNLQ